MQISTEPKKIHKKLFGHPLPKNVFSVETRYQFLTCSLEIVWLNQNLQRDSMAVTYPITEEKIISVLATMRMTC
jgi:hypothetical protein